MKYIVNKNNNQKNLIVKEKLEVDGYSLNSRKHKFTIDDVDISSITVVSKKLAHPFVKKVAYKKYNKVIEKIADLFVSDDDEGTSMNEVLNQIEKFKSEVKNKYRKYLKKKELEEMSTKLKFLQKKAKEKEMQLYMNQNEKKSTRVR